MLNENIDALINEFEVLNKMTDYQSNYCHRFMGKKVILFLSDKNHYLSHDLYCHLARNLTVGIDSIFLRSDFKEYRKWRTNQDTDEQELKNSFSQCITISSPVLDRRPLTNPIFKLLRIFKNLRKKQNWREALLQKIDQINPSLIVITSTIAENTRVVSLYRQSIPKLYIQPCNLFVEHKQQYNFSERLWAMWYNKILKLPILPVKETTFDHLGYLNLALWSELWRSHVPSRKESSFHYTGNPVYDRNFNRYAVKRVSSKKPQVWIYLNKEKHIGQANWNLYADFYRRLMRIQPDFNYVLKAHPHSQLEQVQKLFPAVRVTQALAPKEEVDIMITHWSSSANEFIVEGIPVILVNPEGRFDFSKRYLDHYQAIAKTIEDVKRYFERYLKEGSVAFSEYRKDFILRSLTSDDGRSTERVIKLIEKLSQ